MLSSQKLEDYTTDSKKNLTWHLVAKTCMNFISFMCILKSSLQILYNKLKTLGLNLLFVCLLIKRYNFLLRWFVLLHSELRIDKTRLYNFSKVKKDRRWLKVLENFWVIFLSLSSTSSLFISLQSVRAVRKS